MQNLWSSCWPWWRTACLLIPASSCRTSFSTSCCPSTCTTLVSWASGGSAAAAHMATQRRLKFQDAVCAKPSHTVAAGVSRDGKNSFYFNLQRPELLEFMHLYFLVDIQVNLELMSEKQIFNFSHDLVSDKTMLYWTFPSFIHPRSLTITRRKMKKYTYLELFLIILFRIMQKITIHLNIQHSNKHYRQGLQALKCLQFGCSPSTTRW